MMKHHDDTINIIMFIIFRNSGPLMFTFPCISWLNPISGRFFAPVMSKSFHQVDTQSQPQATRYFVGIENLGSKYKT